VKHIIWWKDFSFSFSRLKQFEVTCCVSLCCSFSARGGGVAGWELLGTSDFGLWPSRALLPLVSFLKEVVTGAHVVNERSQQWLQTLKSGRFVTVYPGLVDFSVPAENDCHLTHKFMSTDKAVASPFQQMWSCVWILTSVLSEPIFTSVVLSSRCKSL